MTLPWWFVGYLQELFSLTDGTVFWYVWCWC